MKYRRAVLSINIPSLREDTFQDQLKRSKVFEEISKILKDNGIKYSTSTETELIDETELKEN